MSARVGYGRGEPMRLDEGCVHGPNRFSVVPVIRRRLKLLKSATRQVEGARVAQGSLTRRSTLVLLERLQTAVLIRDSNSRNPSSNYLLVIQT